MRAVKQLHKRLVRTIPQRAGDPPCVSVDARARMLCSAQSNTTSHRKRMFKSEVDKQRNKQTSKKRHDWTTQAALSLIRMPIMRAAWPSTVCGASSDHDVPHGGDELAVPAGARGGAEGCVGAD